MSNHIDIIHKPNIFIYQVFTKFSIQSCIHRQKYDNAPKIILQDQHDINLRTKISSPCNRACLLIFTQHEYSFLEVLCSNTFRREDEENEIDSGIVFKMQ